MSLVTAATKFFARNALLSGTRDVRDKLDRLQKESQKAQRTSEAIQRSVKEFQFSAQGHLDKINEILAKYQPEEKL